MSKMRFVNPYAPGGEYFNEVVGKLTGKSPADFAALEQVFEIDVPDVEVPAPEEQPAPPMDTAYRPAETNHESQIMASTEPSATESTVLNKEVLKQLLETTAAPNQILQLPSKNVTAAEIGRIIEASFGSPNVKTTTYANPWPFIEETAKVLGQKFVEQLNTGLKVLEIQPELNLPVQGTPKGFYILHETDSIFKHTPIAVSGKPTIGGNGTYSLNKTPEYQALLTESALLRGFDLALDNILHTFSGSEGKFKVNNEYLEWNGPAHPVQGFSTWLKSQEYIFIYFNKNANGAVNMQDDKGIGVFNANNKEFDAKRNMTPNQTLVVNEVREYVEKSLGFKNDYHIMIFTEDAFSTDANPSKARQLEDAKLLFHEGYIHLFYPSALKQDYNSQLQPSKNKGPSYYLDGDHVHHDKSVSEFAETGFEIEVKQFIDAKN